MMLEIEKLHEYEGNAKKHPESQVKKIANSIKEFGFLNPILIDKDNVIIAGHGRYYAAKSLGLKEVPIIRVEHLTQDQVDAYRLADNKLAESEWDMHAVIEQLKYLDSQGLNIELTGFDKDLLIEPDEKDDIVPTDAPTRAKLGQIWALGRHRVMCGDAIKKEDVERLMDGKKADMVFTDPPYGMNLNTDYSGMIGFRGKVGNKFEKVKGDNEDFVADLILKPLEFFDYCKEFFMFGGDYYVDILPNYGKDGSWIVWDKQSNESEIGIGVIDAYGKMFGSNFELCWSKKKHKRVLCRVLWKGMFGMGQGDEKKRIHPTQKPVEVACWFYKYFCPEDGIVVDPYLGSGSTLIACEKTGRVCYGMEIEPKYVDVIIKRYEDYTGNKATKI